MNSKPSKPSSRRQFLQHGAALTGLTMGVAHSSFAQTEGAVATEKRPAGTRAYGQRSKHDKWTRLVDDHIHVGLTTPIQDQYGIITPSGLHFFMDHDHKALPDIDPVTHRLMLNGTVDRPLIFTVDELKTYPSVSRIIAIECNGNSQPMKDVDSIQRLHGRASCSEWTGVSLALLLKEAGMQPKTKWVLAEGAENRNYSISFPIEKALEDSIVAYAQNGESIRQENGFPLRLIVPGFEGNSSVKWLRRIKVGDQPFMPKDQTARNITIRRDGKGMWFNFQMGVKSLITRPGGGQQLPKPGPYAITGLAWSGAGAIRRVEVSTDGGQTWKDAKLDDQVLRHAFTQFSLEWRWNGEETVIMSRGTDEAGEVQPTLAEAAKLRGATVEYILGLRESRKNNRTIGFGDHYNMIQPWRITPDGRVLNDMYS